MNENRAVAFSVSRAGIGPLSWSIVAAATAAFLLGTFIVMGVGLAGSEAIHNAAHDMRHGLAFPCH